jgi:multidrug transporter EmrE-like cation transporter
MTSGGGGRFSSRSAAAAESYVAEDAAMMTFLWSALTRLGSGIVFLVWVGLGLALWSVIGLLVVRGVFRLVGF